MIDMLVPGFGYGVAGAGIATVISSGLGMLYMMTRRIKNKHFQLKHLLDRIDIKAMLHLVAQGQGLAFRAVSRYGLFSRVLFD